MNKDFWKNHLVMIVGILFILISAFGGLGRDYGLPLTIGVLLLIVSAILFIKNRAGTADYIALMVIGLAIFVIRGFFGDPEAGILFGFGIILVAVVCFLIGSAVKNKKKSSN